MLAPRWFSTIVLALALAGGPARPVAAEPRHAVFAEALGKGGLWGIGYDFQLSSRFAIGGVGSYYVLNGDRYLTLSPYLAGYPLGQGHHRWFVQAGPQLVRRSTPSPVPEWTGMATSAFGGELSTGYEYRNRVLIRGYAMVAVGDNVAPWVGASFGWTL